MTLWTHVHGGYASYDNAHAWKQDDYDSLKLVQTLKGKPISGYATLKKANGTWVKITTAQPAGAFELWGEWGAAKALAAAPAGALLVPVPSSDCLGWGGDAKGKALCEAIAQRAPSFDYREAIYWKEQFQKSSEGGPRDPEVLYGNILVHTALPKREVILIDDVVTGGGHLIACARALRWAGHKVEHAICAALTVKSPPEGGMYNIPAWDLEANPFSGS